MTTTSAARPPPSTASSASRCTGRCSSAGMLEVRAQELFFEGLVRGTTHLGVGQEAVATGFALAMRADDYTFCTYRGHNHNIARGVPMGPILAELFGRSTGSARRQGRLDAPDLGRAWRARLVRDRRGAPADRPGGRVVRPVPQVRPGRGLLLRRRDDEHRRVPRGPQHGRRLEGAGRVRVREQPVHGVHADRRRDRGRPAGRRPGECLRPRADRRRRQRRRGGPRDRDDGHRPGTGRRRPVAHRGPHVSPRRSLAGRPRQVPAGRRGRGLEGPRPDPGLPGTAGGRRRRDGRRSTPSTRRSAPRSRRPRPRHARVPSRPRTSLETQVWADGGSAWRN